MTQTIIDTGPLVAFLNARDSWHGWLLDQWRTIQPPLITCEPVITEACFLLQNIYGGRNAIMELLARNIVPLDFSLSLEYQAVHQLLERYESVPMSLADACLVRMAELYPNSQILTLDSDFYIYRKHRNQQILLRIPDSL
ncbi:MAG: toxin-antitoxin system COG2402 family toxin component [Phormidium sp. OSCR]|nr:MAG: toxin-antitoxin system COG2402 family toxin component [Phormidium sp. OSCR]